MWLLIFAPKRAFPKIEILREYHNLRAMVAAVSGEAPEPQNPKTAAAAAAAASQNEHPKRPPLLPSEKDNSNGAPNKNPRKPKSRVVSSRYMSPSTSSTSTSNSSSISSSSSSSSSLSASRRFPSPLISRNSNPPSSTPSLLPKRSVSADRRRPTPLRAAARPLLPDLDTAKNSHAPEISSAARLLVTSTRSLSVSFQGEAFSLPISKTKTTPSSPNLSTVRKITPERRRNSTPSRTKVEGDHIESSKPSDQHHLWPARTRLVTATSLSRSFDCTGNSNGNSVGNNGLSLPCNQIPSDSDSVSSDSTSGAQECGLNGPKGLAISARFWQETNSRLRRLQDPGSPLSTSPGSKLIVPPKVKRYSSDATLMSSPRTVSSPLRGATRAASPGKLMSPLRAHSPSRIRNAVSTICNSFLDTPSVLSFAVDVRRGKVGENRIVDAHLLRLLYNRHLQWRFVNARTEDVLLVQKHGTEKNLWNAWIAISDLRDTVTKKRHRLQLLRQKLKLASILRGQVSFIIPLFFFM
ncbi:hypothetical protein STAS_19692 [Striga asiatica]|uniref:QWRF motif-containing protein 2 n=1 Tax=Striga asiatica TaxID=4170 RepID=A0A5A7QCC5_STRAF|nr:hypothetical protein STAS_19692 [Striga asiatica]